MVYELVQDWDVNWKMKWMKEWMERIWDGRYEIVIEMKSWRISGKGGILKSNRSFLNERQFVIYFKSFKNGAACQHHFKLTTSFIS